MKGEIFELHDFCTGGKFIEISFKYFVNADYVESMKFTEVFHMWIKKFRVGILRKNSSFKKAALWENFQKTNIWHKMKIKYFTLLIGSFFVFSH